ncbi:MAG TPA: CoA ester lyase [Candidatus Sulfotelmatobacter sp.]|nr:CoA ester lyase [Candidatus Sulfotelmatobacter sp.]
MRPLRSLLFVPGNKPRMHEKAAGSGADALILDLEDSVPPAEKPAARPLVREALEKVRGPALYVRVNGDGTPWLAEDLAAVVCAGLAGIMLPKAEHLSTLRMVAELLAAAESRAGLPPGGTEIILQIETALGVRNTYELASARRVASVCPGTARDGDLQRDLGAAWSLNGPELAYARGKVLLDAKAAGIAYPLDGVYADFQDDEGFLAEATLARRMGYCGKTLIHPRQIPLAHRAFTPAAKEVAYYRRLLDAFEAAVAAGSASVSLDGTMVDVAMAERARRFLALADQVGVQPDT